MTLFFCPTLCTVALRPCFSAGTLIFKKLAWLTLSRIYVASAKTFPDFFLTHFRLWEKDKNEGSRIDRKRRTMLKGERYSCGEKDREYGIRTEIGGGGREWRQRTEMKGEGQE